MEHDGGITRAEAEETAARELGFDTADALYRAAVEGWRLAIMATPPTGNRDLDKLAAVSLNFLGGGWALKVLGAGWDEVSLFGIHEGNAPRERLDAWGMMSFVAWGTRGYTIEACGRDFCVLRTSSGSTLRLPRMRSNFDAAVPFWRHILNASVGLR